MEFKYKGFRYKIVGKQVWRLAGKVRGRFYKKKKLDPIMLSPTIVGYRICRDKKSLKQIRLLCK